MQVSSIRVLILEDNPDETALIADQLRRAGFAPDWQRVETEADYAARLAPTVDLILADSRLARWNVLDALAMLQARALDIPFLVVVDAQSENMAIAAMNQGAADYVFKDRLARLGLAIDRAMEAKRLREQQRQTQATLRASETRFRALIEKALEAILLVERGGTMLYASPSTERITGYTSDERIGHSLFELLHPDDLNANLSLIRSLLGEPGESIPIQARVLHKDGSWRWIEGIATNLLDEPGVEAVVINYRDITERQRSEQRIHKLNRLNAVRSDVNQAIVRIRSLPALFQNVCDIAVKQGAFRMAWIGLIAPSEQVLQPVAQAGAVDGYLGKVFNRESQRQAPFAEALFKPEHMIVNDIARDALAADWPGYAEALERGYRSMARFPLVVRGTVQGSFSVYAGEPYFFDDEQISLLDELATDLSFAMEIAEQETLRQQAESALNDYAKRMEILHDIDAGLIEAQSVQLLCDTVLRHLQQLIPCRHVSIGLLGDTDDEALIFAIRESPPPAISPGTRVRFLPDWRKYFAAGPIHIIDDLRMVEEPGLTRQRLVKEGMVSVCEALLIAQGQPIGLLRMAADTPGYFTAKHGAFIQVIAGHLALVLQQMRLSEALAQQATQLAAKVAERTTELQSVKERVEAILNNSLDGILLAHADLRIQQTNAACEMLLGCERDEYFNQSLLDVIHADDADRVAATVQAVLDDRTGRHIEARISRRDGTPFEAELSLGCVQVPGRNVNGVVCTIRDITERKRAEQSLIARMEHEQEFQNYLKELHEITIELTPVDELDEFYRRVVELGLARLGFDRIALFLLGGEPGAVRGTYGTDPQGRVVDERHLQFTPLATSIMHRAAQRSERFHHEEDHTLQSNRQPVGIGWNAAAVLWDGTEMLGWLVADNLIHHKPASKPLLEILALYSLTVGALLARKRVEAILRDSETRLRESQQMLKSLLESIPVRAFWKDKNSVYLGCNRLMAEDAGLASSEEIVGKSDFELPWRDLAPEYEEDDRVLLTTGLSRLQVEEALTVAGGAKIWFQANKIPLRDSRGDITGIIGAYVEITKLKQAEEALRASEARFRSVIEAAPDSILVGDAQGTILMANPAALRNSGYDSAALLGHNIIEFFTPDSQAVLAREYPCLLANGTTRQEVEFVRCDGTVAIVDSSCAIIYGDDGQPQSMIIVQHDITRRKQTEEALRQAFEKEKELSELKSRFVSMASHEFRNPLATILAATETLTAYRPKMTDSQIDQRLNHIRDQVGHLKAVMEDVLQLARLQARRAQFSPVSLDLDALCQSIIDEFQSHPDITHDIRYTCDAALQAVKLDNKLMRQILGNLISNAIKYSPDYSAVSVRLASAGGSMVLEVQDEGIGIPEADLKHLFEPFHRAANVGAIAGTGLGLIITREAVELHGGTITVDSQLGAGTTITVSIPLAGKGADGDDENPGR